MTKNVVSLATRSKLGVLALAIVAAMSLAPNGFASGPTVLFNGVGSSGAFNAVGLAARLSGGTSGVCGSFNWTRKSGVATGYDSRSSAIAAVSGSIWVVWDTEPATKVCAYLNVDSVQGMRMFFAVPRGTLQLPSSAIGSAGDNQVPLFPADTPLPTDVYNALNNLPFNAGLSDIRAEDALFATTRALATLGSTVGSYKGEGYGPGPIGSVINTAFGSGKYAEVVNFALSGTDPITGDAVPAWVSSNVAGQTLIVIVNNSDTSAAGLGNSAFNNIDRFTLGRIVAGLTTRTRDIIPGSGLPIVPLHTILRESMSGTWNTFEYCIPNSREVVLSQETGVNPAVDNPLNQTYADGGTRQRAIGTGEEVKEVGATADSIGYTFFSFGNVAPVVSTAKYLTVDGVDPLYASYSGGTLPTCVAPCPGAVTFPNTINGSYPIWNILRITTDKVVPSGVTSLIAAAQSEFENIPDLIPIAQMQVFRSHYAQSGYGAKNGHIARSVEAGGDMGGAVLTVQEDSDSITDTKKEITSLHQ